MLEGRNAYHIMVTRYFLRMYYGQHTTVDRCQRGWLLRISSQLNSLGLHSYNIGNVFHRYISIKLYLFFLSDTTELLLLFAGVFSPVSTYISGIFLTLMIMNRYDFNQRVLVSTSAHISSVGKYSTNISHLLITSFTNKYLTLMCLKFFKLDF